MSILNLDIFCCPVCADHVAQAVIAHLDHAAICAPVRHRLAAALDLILDRDRKVSADIADIGEVEGCFLIFHTISIGS